MRHRNESGRLDKCVLSAAILAALFLPRYLAHAKQDCSCEAAPQGHCPKGKCCKKGCQAKSCNDTQRYVGCDGSGCSTSSPPCGKFCSKQTPSPYPCGSKGCDCGRPRCAGFTTLCEAYCKNANPKYRDDPASTGNCSALCAYNGWDTSYAVISVADKEERNDGKDEGSRD